MLGWSKFLRLLEGWGVVMFLLCVEVYLGNLTGHNWEVLIASPYVSGMWVN